TVPPLPGSAPAPAPGVTRIVQLLISAARVDGTLSEGERAEILTRARAAGGEALVAPELDRSVPLAEIVRGVADPAEKRDLYALAFAVVHADEGVSGAERIYLAQLAAVLGLDTAAATEIERDVVARIEEAARA